MIGQPATRIFQLDASPPVSNKHFSSFPTERSQIHNKRVETHLFNSPKMSNEGMGTSAPKNEDDQIVQILSNAKLIAVVGATNRESMPVYGVLRYLQDQVRANETSFVFSSRK